MPHPLSHKNLQGAYAGLPSGQNPSSGNSGKDTQQAVQGPQVRVVTSGSSIFVLLANP